MRVDLCLSPKQFSPADVRKMLPALRNLLRRHGAQGAYLFGSIRQGPGSALSDLDIAVLPPFPLPDWFSYYDGLYEELCQLFQADNIDLVLLSQAPLTLLAEVILNGESLFQENSAVNFEDRVLARYADLAGWRQENWMITRQLAHRGVVSEVMMVNRERIERFVFLVRDAVQELRALGLADLSLEAYVQDKLKRALSEHYLRLAIEATLDLGRHVIVKTGLGIPQEYREVGKILRTKGIVPTELGHRLEAMAGMRNVLVHLYRDIDYSLLHKTIQENLDAFEECITHLFLYLDKLNSYKNSIYVVAGGSALNRDRG